MRAKIMAILNVTPDSFSDGGRYDGLEAAVRRGLLMADQGAHILDIGGESTRPGAETISVDEELRRVLPVIMAIREQSRARDDDIMISIDTRKAAVAKAAIHAGADVWNDVSALTYDPESESVAAQLQCPLILMHAQGRPETMQDNPHYEMAVSDIISWLEKRLDACEFAGIDRGLITIDPGIGFGKRQEDNLALIRDLAQFKTLGRPILMGASRKSFIGKIDGSTADDRVGGSLACALYAMSQGADILRVHDVVETVQAVKVWESIDEL